MKRATFRVVDINFWGINIQLLGVLKIRFWGSTGGGTNIIYILYAYNIYKRIKNKEAAKKPQLIVKS